MSSALPDPTAPTTTHGGAEPATGFSSEGSILTSLTDAVIAVDTDWAIRYVNRSARKLLENASGGYRGRLLWEVLPPAVAVPVGGKPVALEQLLRRAAASQASVRVEVQIPERGLWLKVQSDTLDDGSVIIVRDVTDSRAAQSALRSAEARHRAILNAVPDLILWVDTDGHVVDAEPAATPNLHPNPSELMGRHLSDTLPAGASTQLLQALAAADEAAPVTTEYSLAQGFFEARLVPAGERGAIIVVRDITERRALEQAVLNAGDEERRRIGRDLHDGLASHLTGVAMLASRLARDCRRDQSIAAEHLDELSELIREGVRQARLLAHGLNPVMLEQKGLCSALHALAESSRIVGDVDCMFAGACSISGSTAPDDCLEHFPQIEAPAATHLLRIAQEAVHNARRHAEPSRVTITLGTGWGHLFIGIKDDGRGMDPETPPGMGMHVMRYRAHLIGATLDIVSSPGTGTTVTCDLPIAALGHHETTD